MKTAESETPLVIGVRLSASGQPCIHKHQCGHQCNSPYCDSPPETDCEKCGGPMCGGPISAPQRTWGRN